MIKKEYIQPELQVYKLNYATPILAGSEKQDVSSQDADPESEGFETF